MSDNQLNPDVLASSPAYEAEEPLSPPPPPNSDTGEDGYFGLCPICHKRDGSINIGASHWYYCKQHKMCWFVGENLFSTWREQTEEEQRRIYDDLDFGSFSKVEPYPYCEAGGSQ